MSIELPEKVVWLLHKIGVDWPDVNEDQVRAFAGHVRQFAGNLEDTHDAATATISQMSASYSGASYEQLVESWAQKSQSHMRELIDACHTVATALDVAADAIVAAKGVAIGELIGLAVSFIADQAAAVFTFGIAEAAEAAIVLAAKRVVDALEQELEQHIMGEVISKAVTPLEDVVERALGGLVYKGMDAALGDPTAGGGAGGTGFMIVPSEVQQHANTLRGHADDVASHAATFANNVAAVNFSG